MRDRDPAHLHPVMLPLLREHRNRAAADPLVGPTVLYETARSSAQQDADWQRGRDAAGNIVDRALVVTQKRGGDSRHNLVRWARVCPDCPHEARDHIGAPGRPEAPRCCSAEGHQIGEGCPCAVDGVRLERFAEWRQLPASLAYHLGPLCRGCHPPGSIIGLPPHDQVRPGDLAILRRLAGHGQDLGLRSGYDWDGDHVYGEAGEWDMHHNELAAIGTLGQVKAVLAIKGGDLVWPGRTT